ncbi:MAG: hypothetical protein JWM09_648 [Francisellaceae bacterium]|nr:hypothetical protein [Francisellaceae bacterium]
MSDLSEACKSGDLNQVKLLLAQGWDVRAENNEAIRLAASFGHFELVNLLLDELKVGASANNNEAIRFAARFGHLKVVNRLLEVQGVDVRAENNYAIRFAASNGHLDVVERLLEIPEVDATAEDNEAIREAAAFGHLEVVNRLLKVPGVDVTAENNYAIREAAFFGHLEVVRRLLELPGVDATAENNYAIRQTRYNCHLEVMDLIIETLRLQILADFNIAHQKEQLKEVSFLELDFTDTNQQFNFKIAVLKRMGNIKGIESLVERKIIQKTFNQYKKQISCNDPLAIINPIKELDLNLNGEGNLNQKFEINFLLKETPSEAQSYKQKEENEENPTKENFIQNPTENSKRMHLVHYECLSKSSTTYKSKIEKIVQASTILSLK